MKFIIIFARETKEIIKIILTNKSDNYGKEYQRYTDRKEFVDFICR